MNVTSPTTTRHALISSYFLLYNVYYISVSFTLLINKTHITEERRKKRRNEGRRKQRNEDVNKRTKETHIQHNSIKLKSWWTSLLCFENNLFYNEEFVLNSMKMKSSKWHTKKEERRMKIHIEHNHNIHEKDRVYIDAYGDVIDVTLAMSFLHDTLHLFLLFFFVTFFLSSSSCVCTSQTRQS